MCEGCVESVCVLCVCFVCALCVLCVCVCVCVVCVCVCGMCFVCVWSVCFVCVWSVCVGWGVCVCVCGCLCVCVCGGHHANLYPDVLQPSQDDAQASPQGLGLRAERDEVKVTQRSRMVYNSILTLFIDRRVFLSPRDSRMGTSDMKSTPPAITTSLCPEAI